jgi:microcystin-dependent protein
MAGVVETTNTFATNDVITSTAMNNIIDQTLFTSDAIAAGNTTLALVSGKMKVGTITSNEMGTDSVTTNAIADGAVTQAKASNMLVPAGAIMPFAMNGAPTGWLAADGTAVSRSTYATLFAAIATTYGVGDGSTTFNVPDLRGYFVRGTGTNSDGTVSGTFAAKQADAFQGHYHNLRQGTFVQGGSNNTVISAQNHNFDVNSVVSPITDGTNGTPRTASETRPRNIAMFYCIKF